MQESCWQARDCTRVQKPNEYGFQELRELSSMDPFPETKELIAGYWIWKVKSIEEAVEWVKRCPNPMNSESDIDIRPIFEAEDFGAELTPKLKEQEDRLRSKIEEQAK
jgi:hypothetical protein